MWKDQSTLGIVRLEESSESKTTPSSDQENELAGGLLSLSQETVREEPSGTGSSGRTTVTSGRAKKGVINFLLNCYQRIFNNAGSII